MKQRPSLIIFMKKHVNLPALLAFRMQRYSLLLIVVAMVSLFFNRAEITPGTGLWFVAGLSAVFALLCGIGVTILDAIAWNFERLREELGHTAITMEEE